MHSVVHVNLHCRVASSHLHRPRANVERDVHFKKELDFLIYMRRLAAGVKPCLPFQQHHHVLLVVSSPFPSVASSDSSTSESSLMHSLLWRLYLYTREAT